MQEYMEQRAETFMERAGTDSLRNVLWGDRSSTPLGKYISSNPDLSERAKNIAGPKAKYHAKATGHLLIATAFAIAAYSIYEFSPEPLNILFGSWMWTMPVIEGGIAAKAYHKYSKIK